VYSNLGCVSYIFMNFAILYFTHGSTHSFPVFIQNNSCNPVSNAWVELKLSAWTIYGSVIILLLQIFSHPLISLMLYQLHSIVSLLLLTVPPPFSAYTVNITSNNLKSGNLQTVSFDSVKNPGERLTFICWALSLSSGVWKELVWQLLVALI